MYHGNGTGYSTYRDHNIKIGGPGATESQEIQFIDSAGTGSGNIYVSGSGLMASKITDFELGSVDFSDNALGWLTERLTSGSSGTFGSSRTTSNYMFVNYRPEIPNINLSGNNLAYYNDKILFKSSVAPVSDGVANQRHIESSFGLYPYSNQTSTFNVESTKLQFWQGTQSDYDALGYYDSNTIYFVT